MPLTWRAAKVQYPRGTYWNIRARQDGTKLNLSLGYVTEAEARRAADRMTSEEALGRAGKIRDLHKRDREAAIRYLLEDAAVVALVTDEPDYGRMTVRQYFDRVFADWRAEAVPASWKTEERRWTQILDGIGDAELQDVDAHLVADYLDELTVDRGPRKGQPMSGNSRRLYRAAIKAMLHRAYRLRHIPALPDLGVFRIPGSTKRVVEKPDPLDLEELVELMDASAPKFRAMWAVGAGQGLRPSELMRVRWEDVHAHRRTLDVRGTKTDLSEATVPLTGLARRELQRWHKECGQPATGLVFPSESGGMYSPQGYRKALRNAAKTAGIKRRVYPYLLRDSFATIAWSIGVDMDIARRILRHTDDTMLRDVYCRPRPEDLAKFVEAFDYE